VAIAALNSCIPSLRMIWPELLARYKSLKKVVWCQEEPIEPGRLVTAANTICDVVLSST